MAKLFSCLGIGPQISNFLGFDLVIYDGTIEFVMENCQDFNPLIHKSYDYSSLIPKLALMHSLGFVHCDIKEDNVMVSEKRQ